jgi:hypothetical protein
MQMDDWLKSGKYLPEPLRDFHNAKTIFKILDEVSGRYKWGFLKPPDWMTAQMYVIDIFLWWMAKRGYTLQRTRAKVEGLRDLHEDTQAFEEQLRKEFRNFLESRDTEKRKEA